MERKLTKVVDETEITVIGKMCSCGTDAANDLCSWECPDTYRVRGNDAVLWKREEKVGFDHKILWVEGKNKTEKWLVFARFFAHFR